MPAPLKNLAFLSIFALLSACASNIHPEAKYAQFLNNYDLHIVNDTMQMYVKTPADIDFVTDKSGLKKSVKSLPNEAKAFKHLPGLVLAGTTNSSPHYRVYAWVLPRDYELPEIDAPLGTTAKRTSKSGKVFLLGLPEPGSRFESCEADLNNMALSARLGENYRSIITTPMNLLDDYKSTNQFLAATTAFQNYPAYDRGEQHLCNQMMLTFGACMEGWSPDEAWSGPYFPKQKLAPRTPLDQQQSMAYVLAEAAKTPVTIINEQHYVSRHRQMTYALLKPLRDLGYTHLALETLMHGQEMALNAGEAPTTETGVYSVDPRFREMIAYAQELGYAFIAYENVDPGMDRELGQASVLVKVLEEYPGAKILVHAGIDHVLEAPTSRGTSWMAAQLNELTEINPFTINQVLGDAFTSSTAQDWTLLPTTEEDGGKAALVDAILINNLSPNAHLLPSNLGSISWKNPTNSPVQFDLYPTSTQGKSLRREVPVRSFYVEGKNTLKATAPKGTFRALARNSENNVVFEGQIRID